MIYILQYEGKSLISKLIQSATLSKYSHSAIADSDGFVVEAWEKKGVDLVASPWENHTKNTPVNVYVIDAKNPLAIWNEALSHTGDRYDYYSILGFLPVLRHFWSDAPRAWFCSHLVEHCCRKGGSPLFSQETPLYKISPGLIPYSPVPRWVGRVFNDREYESLLEAQV